MSTADPTSRPRYDAFLSYSHEGADRSLSESIQRGLHRLAKPWYRPPVVRVFRDGTSLSANTELWSTLERALVDSEFLIVLASPRAAASRGVDREVSSWLTHKAVDRILIVLTEGSIRWDQENGRLDRTATDALPPALCDNLSEEPFWIDLSWARPGEDLTLTDSRFRDAVARLAAPLHHTDLEALIGEDLTQQRRTTRWRNSAIAVLGALTVLAGTLAYVAYDQRNIAVAQRDISDARRLAAQAVGLIDRQDDLAQLLSLESLRRAPTAEGWEGVQQTLSQQLHRSWQLTGPTTAVLATAFSSDGALLATGGADDTLRLWDAATRTARGSPLTGHTGAVLAVAFHPDPGRHLLVSGSTDGTVRIWSTETAGLVHTLTPDDGAISAVVFSPDGSLLATGGADGIIRLWDTDSWQPAGPPPAGHVGDVYALAFRPDGRVLASSGRDALIRLWDLPTRRPLVPPLVGDSPQRSLRTLAFSPDGQRLISAGDGGDLLIWAAPWRDTPPTSLPNLDDEPRVAAFDPAYAQVFVTAGSDGVVRFWDLKTLTPALAPITGHTARINALSFSPDGGLLVTGSDDSTARLWESVPRQPNGDPLSVDGGTLDHVTFHPTRPIVATSGTDAVTRLWDIDSGRLLHELRGHTTTVEAVAFSPDGQLLATGSQDMSIRLWRVDTGEPVGEPLLGNTAAVPDLAFSPRGDLLASAGADGTARLWDVATGRPIGRPLEHSGLVLTVEFAPDGSYLATAGQDGEVRRWDVGTGALLGRPLVHRDAIVHINISKDGQLLAAAGFDGTAVVWDIATGAIVSDIPTFSTPAIDVGFSPDRDFLAVALLDGTVRLWNLRSGQGFGRPIEVDSDAAQSVSFSPDGSRFAASGVNGVTRLYTAPRKWIETSCRIVGRNLTQAEWDRYSGDSNYVRSCAEYPSGPGAPANAPIATYSDPSDLR